MKADGCGLGSEEAGLGESPLPLLSPTDSLPSLQGAHRPVSFGYLAWGCGVLLWRGELPVSQAGPLWAARERASVVRTCSLGAEACAAWPRPYQDGPLGGELAFFPLPFTHAAAISHSWAWTPAVTRPVCARGVFRTDTECSSGEGRQLGWIRAPGTPVQAPAGPALASCALLPLPHARP